MTSKIISRTIVLVAGILSLSLVSAHAQVKDPMAINQLGRFMLDARLRHEFVDQEDFARDAHALTLRARAGFETRDWRGFSILVEGDATRDLGPGNFNSTVNGKATQPVIPDPNSERLNRAHARYAGPMDMTLTAGRQRITLDNQRFIGAVGFRQNEQTFDAVRMTATPMDGVTFDYSYLWRVNRVFGSRSPVGTEKTASHMINTRTETPAGTLSAYAYLVDLRDMPMASSQTYGMRLAGDTPLVGPTDLFYSVEVARQSDYGGNPASYALGYHALEAGVRNGPWTIIAGYEVLEGNGTTSFATPLGTLHGFQGFADVFLNTPPPGIKHARITAEYRLPHTRVLGPVRMAAWFHDFRADHGNGKLGREIDIGLYATPTDRVSLSVEYADFRGNSTDPSRRKLWFTMGYRY